MITCNPLKPRPSYSLWSQSLVLLSVFLRQNTESGWFCHAHIHNPCSEVFSARNFQLPKESLPLCPRLSGSPLHRLWTQHSALLSSWVGPIKDHADRARHSNHSPKLCLAQLGDLLGREQFFQCWWKCIHCWVKVFSSYIRICPCFLRGHSDIILLLQLGFVNFKPLKSE